MGRSVGKKDELSLGKAVAGVISGAFIAAFCVMIMLLPGILANSRNVREARAEFAQFDHDYDMSLRKMCRSFMIMRERDHFEGGENLTHDCVRASFVVLPTEANL